MNSLLVLLLMIGVASGRKFTCDAIQYEEELMTSSRWKRDIQSEEEELMVSRRSKRDTGDFTMKYDQVVMASRVFAGIALRIGLGQGDVPGDEAVAELLNVGSVNMDDFEQFDKTNIDSLVTKLQSLDVGTTLQSEMEQMIVLLKQWGEEFAALGNNIKDTAAVNKYFQMFYDFKFSGFEAASNITKPDIPTVIKLLEGAKNLPDSVENQKQFNDAYSYLLNLKNNLDLLASLKSSIGKMVEICKNNAVLDSEESLRSIQYRFVRLVKDFLAGQDVLNSLTPAAEKKITGMFANVAALSGELNASRTDLLIVSAVDSAVNTDVKMHNRQHTSGFINGFADLHNIANDVRDPWMTSVLGRFDSQLIESELAALAPLYDKSKVVVDKWKPVVSKELHQLIRRMDTVVNGFGNVSAAAATGGESIAKMKGCLSLKPMLQSDAVDKAWNVYLNATDFNQKFNNIKNILHSLEQSSLKELENLSELRNVIIIPDSGLNFQQTSQLISNKFIMVHCADGVLRCGPFISIDLLVLLWRARPITLNINNVVLMMRRYRGGFFTNPAQMMFSTNMALQAIIDDHQLDDLREEMEEQWRYYELMQDRLFDQLQRNRFMEPGYSGKPIGEPLVVPPEVEEEPTQSGDE